MLDIRNLVVRRGRFEAKIDHLSVASGECASLCGVSGSGKSTLLEGIGLLTENFAVDSFALDGLELQKLSADERQLVRMRYMGIMPQSGGMLPFLTVEENLILQMKLAWRTQVPPELHMAAPQLALADSEAIDQRYLELQELCESLHLADKLQKLPSELSIGQRQRALFVRALAHKPRLLLIDEPTSALDPENALRLFEIIEKVTAQCQTSTLIVTHDLDAVRDYRHFSFDPTQSHAGSSVFQEEVAAAAQE